MTGTEPAQSDDANREETAKAEKALDAQQAPAPGGVGVAKSDEVLDLAKPALEFFTRWADQVWNRIPGSRSGKIDPPKDIRDRFAENAGLDFRKFLYDAESLANARQAVDGTHADATQAVTSLFHDWQGDGAAAAKAKYEHDVRPGAQDLLDQLDGAAKLIPETMTHVYTALKTKVDEALKLRVDEIATAPLHLANQVVDVAEGKIGSKDELLDIAQWLDTACPGNDLYARLQDDGCELDDENKDYAIGAAKQWLSGPFAAEFGQRYDSFKGLCTTATDTITAHFQTLSRFMAGFANPFPAGGSGAASPADSATPGPATGESATRASSGSSAGADRSTSSPAVGTPAGGSSDELTTASASFSDIGAHVLDSGAGAEHAPADGQLGIAPGGATIDPLGAGEPTGTMPDGTSGFGGMGMGMSLMGGGLGTTPGNDQPRSGSQHRVGDDVFEPRASGSRISGSLNDDSDRPAGGR